MLVKGAGVVLDMIYDTFNTLRPRHNVRHFPDDILKCISYNEMR